MNLDNIRDMYTYNYWANRRILTTAEQVTPEQFVAPSFHSFSTLQATLVHTLDAEWAWRLLLSGQAFPGELNPADFPTVAAIQQHWQQEEDAMWAYINSLTENDLTSIIRYPVEGGIIRERVIWHCLYHVVNHGMQHRSEAASLLTHYGHSPGEIDFTVFLNERAQASKG